MKILYTTSFEDGRPPVNAGGSIGGYVSTGEVRNDDLDSLFSNLSLYSAYKGKPEYRAIVIQNDSSEKMLNVRLSLEMEDKAMCNFSFAPVAMTKDSEGRWVMERVSDIYSKPIFANFINEEVGIGDIEGEGCVGIWLRRNNNRENIKENYNDVARRKTLDPYLWESIEKKDEEVAKFIIEWD